MWERASGQAVKRFKGHTMNISGIVVNPSNPLEIASYGWDGALFVYVLAYIL